MSKQVSVHPFAVAVTAMMDDAMAAAVKAPSVSALCVMALGQFIYQSAADLRIVE
jgi:hypothetical protein